MKFSTFLLFLFYVCMGQGQNVRSSISPLNETLTFYQLDTDAGLSNNMVRAIAQDGLGFIWIGTADGINRYDGNEFKVFRKETSDLSDNYIQRIYIKENGNLLFGTDGGFNIHNPRKNSFERFVSDVITHPNNINSFVEGANGELFLGANDQGVHVFKDHEQVYLYNHVPGDKNTLSSNKIAALAKQNDSIIWAGTYDGGLNKLDHAKKTVVQVSLGESPSYRINVLFVDSDNNLWIGSNEGLKVISAKGVTLTLKKSATPSGLTDNDVICFEEDDFGRIWVGTYNGGLNIINRKEFLSNDVNFQVKWYLPKEDGSSVSNATVKALKKDAAGNMWIGTYAGVNFVDPRGEPIKLLKSTLPNSQKLAHDRIFSLAEAQSGKIWIGTEGGGLDLYDPNTGNFRYSLYSTDNRLKDDHIFSLLETDQKQLWIGTYLGGLHKYDQNTQKWSYYLQGNPSKGSDVRVIFESRTGQIWVGTNRGGLYKYMGDDDEFQYIESLDKIDVRDITEDKNGILWLATYGDGVIRFDPKTEENHSYNMGTIEGLTSNIIFCITALSDGQIVAGTKHGGLVQFSVNSKAVFNLTEKNGLSNNTVNSIVNYDDNNLWLGTFKGISRYDPQTRSIQNLNAFNAIQKSEYNAGAALISKSGHLYFGGNRGLNIFDPKTIEYREPPNTIVIKDLLVFNETVPVTGEDKGGILPEAILYRDHIELHYDQTVFSVEFSSLKFPYANNISYSYILEGFNDHWIDIKNSTRINFSNIPPGDYTLKIKTKTLAVMPSYKELGISVLPPFWKTLPAYIFYVVILELLIVSSVRYYSERMHLKNSLLFEKKQRKLEKDINEERIRFYTGFSHELKTPLTMILAPLEALMNGIKSKEQRVNLKLIERNTHNLLQFINKLLEFRKTEEGLIKLNVGRYNISKHLSKWLSSHIPLAAKKDITFSVTIPSRKILVYCDLEKIQIIVNNLLSNAIKYTPSHGKIEIALIGEGENIHIRVSDSGTGIKANDMGHIFEWYYQADATLKKDGTGIGLALSKRFAELHQGTIEVASDPPHGATFILTIPLGNSLALEKQADPTFGPFDGNVLDGHEEVSSAKTEMATESFLHHDPNRKLILLIDDNPDIHLFLNGALKNEYDLINAENGDEGIKKACKYVPDLIVSDVMMPLKNGMEVCHFLKNCKETSHIPIILLSAKSNHKMIESGYVEGADDYMVKPFNLKVLRARIKNLIEGRKLLQEYFKDLNGSDEGHYSPKQSKFLENEKKFLKEFEKVVLKNLQQDIKTVEVVSQEMAMSKSSLFRKIKALTGQNTNEYIRSIKMERAAHLIKKENFTISQAAFEVGFGNIKYFRKSFKEKYGMTPSELKKI